MSAPRCQPGDLAIIIGAPLTLTNIGKIVKVVRPAIEGADLISAPGTEHCVNWVVESVGGLLETAHWGDRKNSFGRAKAHPDCLLMPIRPNGPPTAGDITRKRSKLRTKAVGGNAGQPVEAGRLDASG